MISNRQIMQIALQKPERNGKDTSQVRWGLFEQFLGRVSQPGGPPAEIPELVPMAQVLVALARVLLGFLNVFNILIPNSWFDFSGGFPSFLRDR